MSSERLPGRYWRFWSASTVSSFGDGVRAVALPLLAAEVSTDPRAVAAVTAAEFLPWLLLSLLAGALVDRLDKRQVMWVADVVRFALLAGLAAAVGLDAVSIPLLCAVGFLLGSAQTMFDNASQAILPAVVDRDGLPRANGLLFGAMTVGGQFAGPPLGALAFALSAPLPFAADAGSFLLSAALVLSVSGSFRVVREPTANRPTLRADVRDGVRYLLRHRMLRTLCLLLGVMNFANSAWAGIAVLWALQVLHVGTTGFGVLFLGQAAGSLLGAIVAAPLDRRLGRGTTLRLAYLLSVLATGLLALVTNAWVAGTILFLDGFMIPLWNVATVSLRQEIVPAALLGRVNSAYRMVGWGAGPIGAVAGGVIANQLGLRTPFLVGAGLMVLAGALTYRVVSNANIADVRGQAS